MRKTSESRFSSGKILAFTIGLAATALTASATPVTVQDFGMEQNEVVNITSSTLGTHWVYAGVIDLSVGGVSTDGFCIDPFHWSISGPQSYNTEDLASAPKSPVNGMGAASALKIEQLWGHFFSDSMSAQDAAGLQIAIWEIVGGVNFQINSSDYGASSMLAWVTSNPNATAAALIAVTGPGQDYVIPGTIPHIVTVPDGGETAMLLGMGVLGLVAIRIKSRLTSGAKC